jgi:mono/diheme cytochrome c family protein
MDRFLRPSAAAGLVIAVAFIALLAGFPSLAARITANRVQAATAPSDPKAGSADSSKKVERAGGGPAAHMDKAILERGKQTYAQYCASCHGDTGQGDGPGGANLPIKPQNLTLGLVMNPLPDHFLHKIIADGPQVVGLSALMPPFKPQLGDRQINEVIAYMRTLASPPYEPERVLPVAEKREGPVQPILFSHVIHAGSYRLDCQYCHTGARRSSAAGLPSVERCMGCHKIVAAQGNEQVQKLHAYWEKQQPIPWVRIFKIPEHAQFPHKNHIAAGLQCQTCHGRIEAMEQVHAKTGQNMVNDLANLSGMPIPPTKLTMGWCVECHRAVNEKGVQAVQPVAAAWGSAPRPPTADDKKPRKAPLECVACHH